MIVIPASTACSTNHIDLNLSNDEKPLITYVSPQQLPSVFAKQETSSAIQGSQISVVKTESPKKSNDKEQVVYCLEVMCAVYLEKIQGESRFLEFLTNLMLRTNNVLFLCVNTAL